MEPHGLPQRLVWLLPLLASAMIHRVPSLLHRLFGRSTPGVVEATLFAGNETLEVVGESRHQDALWQIVGGFRREPIRHPCTAMLLPEPDNPVDPHAIRVLVDGRHVGYLSRDDAAVYLPGLRRLIASSETGRVALGGQIVGGGPRADGIGFLGVFLDHDPSDFGIAPHYTTGGSLRTGLSDAIATDLEDDSYDLSWLTTLSDDDATAAAQLRSLLGDERDPIDRHYMLCELEARLYRGRELRAGALDDFDEVCAHHHQEMTELRPVLISKFGVVPVIDMYRQASIRWQKAKQWESAREWAQHGLDAYGEQAARPEVVEDLHKRSRTRRRRSNPHQRRRNRRGVQPSRSWQRHTRPRLRHSPAPPAARVFTGSGHAGASRRPAPHAAGPQRPTRLGIDPVSRDGAGSWDLGELSSSLAGSG